MRSLRVFACVLLALACACVLVSAGGARSHGHRHSAAAPVTPLHSHRGHPDATAGAKLDWKASVFRGVDRATEVDANEPTQIKLAFVPHGMAVSYATAARQSPMYTVHWGRSPQTMTNATVTTEESTYGTLWFYTAVLTGLEDATRYYYQIDGSSLVGSFVTARAAGDATAFTTLIVGDMGLDNSANTMAQMNHELPNTDFFLHIGDLSYADDFYLRQNDTYEGSWNKWQDLMQPITSVAPYMSLPGNHEVTCTEATPFLCPPHQQNMTAYRNRFRMPSRESGGVSNLWYSYDYGLVHFVQINTETDYPNAPMGPGTYFNAGPFGDQMSWLEADLAKFAQNRAKTPWLIVSGHRPIWSSGHEEKEVQAAFEALFLKYEVDIYFAGHVHWYERTWPLAAGGKVTQQNYNQPQGPVYIINGAAGNVEGLTGSANPLPYTATIEDQHFGYGTLRVANATSLHWQYFSASDASLLDEMIIYKQH